MQAKLVICIILTICLCTTDCAKILAIFHVAANSHWYLGSTFAKELARRGHEVTVISSYPQDEPIKNLKHIELTGFLEEVDAAREYSFMQIDANFFLLETVIQLTMCYFTYKVLSHANFQALINSNETFDLVIIEELGSHALKGIAHHYNAPSIIFTSTGATRWVNPQVGNPYPISYVPDVTLPYTGDMTFFQRVDNTLTYLFFAVIETVLVFPLQNWLLHVYFPKAPHLRDLHYNVSLAFVNAHVSTHQPIAHVPNLIDIGGFHIKLSKPLPEDLQKYMDDSKEGVIYFSMGTNTRSVDMSASKRDVILKTFAMLKQQVLWKWEADDLPNKPPNVKIAKWLPQNDILAHPNIKLFITHGGLLSTIEAVHHGIPIIGIPIFADQNINLAHAVNHGWALNVPYTSLTESKLLSAINEVLTKPMHRENAKKMSKILHDQPIKPLDKAIFWTEYVLRHRGASHLRTAGLDLAWYQYLLLDVILFMSTVVIAVIAVIYFVIRICFCRKKQIKRISNKKKIN